MARAGTTPWPRHMATLFRFEIQICTTDIGMHCYGGQSKSEKPSLFANRRNVLFVQRIDRVEISIENLNLNQINPILSLKH